MKTCMMLVLCLLLAACGGMKTKEANVVPVVVNASVPYECGVAPSADRLTMRPVQWKVSEVGKTKLFTLTAPQYEALMSNMINGLSVGKQVRAQRDFYMTCVDRSRKADAKPAPAQVLKVTTAATPKVPIMPPAKGATPVTTDTPRTVPPAKTP